MGAIDWPLFVKYLPSLDMLILMSAECPGCPICIAGCPSAASEVRANADCLPQTPPSSRILG